MHVADFDVRALAKRAKTEGWYGKQFPRKLLEGNRAADNFLQRQGIDTYGRLFEKIEQDAAEPLSMRSNLHQWLSIAGRLRHDSTNAYVNHAGDAALAILENLNHYLDAQTAERKNIDLLWKAKIFREAGSVYQKRSNNSTNNVSDIHLANSLLKTSLEFFDELLQEGGAKIGEFSENDKEILSLDVNFKRKEGVKSFLEKDRLKTTEQYAVSLKKRGVSNNDPKDVLKSLSVLENGIRGMREGASRLIGQAYASISYSWNALAALPEETLKQFPLSSCKPEELPENLRDASSLPHVEDLMKNRILYAEKSLDLTSGGIDNTTSREMKKTLAAGLFNLASRNNEKLGRILENGKYKNFPEPERKNIRGMTRENANYLTKAALYYDDIDYNWGEGCRRYLARALRSIGSYYLEEGKRLLHEARRETSEKTKKHAKARKYFESGKEELEFALDLERERAGIAKNAPIDDAAIWKFEQCEIKHIPYTAREVADSYQTLAELHPRKAEEYHAEARHFYKYAVETSPLLGNHGNKKRKFIDSVNEKEARLDLESESAERQIKKGRVSGERGR